MTDVQSRFRVSFFLSLPDPLHFAFGIPAFSASDFPCLFPGFLCPFSDFHVQLRAIPVRFRLCGVLVRLFRCRSPAPAARPPFLPVCSAFGKKSAVDSSDAALIGGLSCDVGATC